MNFNEAIAVLMAVYIYTSIIVAIVLGHKM